MKYLFYLASGLFGINGLLHLVKVSTTVFDPAAMLPWLITGLFGILYLVIAVMLLLQSHFALWAGLLVPLLGLFLTSIGMKLNPDPNTLAFIGLDIIVIAVCAYLLYTGRVRLGRVR